MPNILKRCKSCEAEKDPVAGFHVNAARPDGRHDYCKTCRSRMTHDRVALRREPTRACLTCNNPVPLVDYGESTKSKDGRRSHCPECERATPKKPQRPKAARVPTVTSADLDARAVKLMEAIR